MATNVQVIDDGAETRAVSDIGKLQAELNKGAAGIRMALPSGITPEKFQRVVLTACMQNPELLKADRQSLLLSVMKAAQDGLLPDGREAALVIYKTSVKVGGDWQERQLVQYIPMIAGIRKKLYQAHDAQGQRLIANLKVGVVYKVEAENGYFVWEPGSDPEIRHQPKLDITAEEAADENIVAAYSIVTLTDGRVSTEVMRRFEIDKVRQSSQSGALGRTVKFGKNKGQPIDPKGPWVDWYPEQAKKTVVKRHSKVLPQSGDVLLELHDDDDIAARSAERLLGLHDGAVPTMLENRNAEEAGGDEGDTNETVNPATGEITEGQPEPDPKPEPSTEKKPAGAAAAQTGASRAGAKASTATEQPVTPATVASGEPADDDGSMNPPAPPADEAAVDETTGVTKEPWEAKADELLVGFKRAETVIDLERLHREFEKHREAFPANVSNELEVAYEVRLNKLAPANA